MIEVCDDLSSLRELDARGLLCPLPVLKMKKHLSEMASGQCLKVLTTDPVSPLDIRFACLEGGHLIKAETLENGCFCFLVQKGTKL